MCTWLSFQAAAGGGVAGGGSGLGVLNEANVHTYVEARFQVSDKQVLAKYENLL